MNPGVETGGNLGIYRSLSIDPCRQLLTPLEYFISRDMSELGLSSDISWNFICRVSS